MDTSSTLLLDISEQMLSVELLSERKSQANHSLALSPAAKPNRADASLRARLCGAPLANFKTLLRAAGDSIAWQKTDMILGVGEDPLRDPLTRLPLVIKILECLLPLNPQSLTFQSRSALSMLLLPSFRGFNDLRCTMALECVDDGTHRKLFPDFSLPSERLAAARALARSGIAVDLQLAPAVLAPQAALRLEYFFQNSAEIFDEVKVCSLSTLLPKQLHGSVFRPLAEAWRQLHPQAERIAAQQRARGPRNERIRAAA